MPNEVNIRNKRASFDYEFLEEYNAGIVLTGTEIKSIRAGKASLVDSYCFFNLFFQGFHNLLASGGSTSCSAADQYM